MSRLFGTDGIRGKANVYPITAEMALRVGKAVAAHFMKPGKTPLFVIGKDTRISGDMLESAVAAGICANGGNARMVGVVPTPAVAFLTLSANANAGVMISASHNPYHDNGIKLFRGDGLKLTDGEEDEIEKLARADAAPESVGEIGRISGLDGAFDRYAEFLKSSVGGEQAFKGMKVVLDCANGATYKVAPRVFEELGADVLTMSNTPDGVNINQNCGSEHTEKLARAVLENRADIGLAFDGDGDRVIAVDETGKPVKGDRLIAICAKSMQAKGKLANNRVVTTVMSNLGLRLALKEMGIEYFAADVGDRYVKDKMTAEGAVLGGEDSGHVIFLDRHTTGDGIYTGIRLVDILREEPKPLSELARIMDIFPQILLNVEVSEKIDIYTIPAIREAIETVERQLGETGRVLVRYSGTQPLCRVMVEAPDQDKTQKYCEQIVDVIREKIGKRE